MLNGKVLAELSKGV